MSLANPTPRRAPEPPSTRAVLRAHADLLACAAVLVLAALLAAAPGTPPAALAAPVALPLVLLVPGYVCVTAALGAPGALARGTLAVATSLALAALGTLVLDAAGARVTAGSLTALLVAVSTPALALAAARRRRDDARDHGRHAPARAARWVVRRPRRSPWPQVAGAALVLATAWGGIAVARTPPAPAARHLPSSATLWALPRPDGRTTIGIRSLETRPTTYAVTVFADGAEVVRTLVTLRPGATWEGAAAIPPDADAEIELATADGRPAPHLDLPARSR